MTARCVSTSIIWAWVDIDLGGIEDVFMPGASAVQPARSVQVRCLRCRGFQIQVAPVGKGPTQVVKTAVKSDLAFVDHDDAFSQLFQVRHVMAGEHDGDPVRAI